MESVLGESASVEDGCESSSCKEGISGIFEGSRGCVGSGDSDIEGEGSEEAIVMGWDRNSRVFHRKG